MKKIAIFYTGESRTIETTINLFKQNVLLNENYHVFAVIQSNNNLSIETLLKENIFENLKNYSSFDKNDETFVKIREALINDINIDENWKNYLRNSGSMIEYYQMYIAYQLMYEYEQNNGFKYDYVMRFRTDTVMKDKIDFDQININKEYIKNILYEIKNYYNFKNIISLDTLNIFMNSFYNQKRISYSISCSNIITTDYFNSLLTIDDENLFIEKLFDYLNNNDYIISYRNNIIYFVKRNVIDKIYMLGINYGKYKYEKDNYWFNAECQLLQLCIENNIDFFTSTSELEGLSLYSYDKINYFNENNNLNDNSFSFFIKRN